jgi:4'-phosphopantetheinyl transferase
MPLETIIQPDAQTKILVWHITEPLAELSAGVQLRPASQARVQGMSSELHQRGFLSVRQMMLTQGYQDTDLFYDITGKPHLTDGKHISISHSHERAAVAISNRPVGIDLEIQREKILRIADRFNDNCNLSKHDPQLYMRELTVVWGFKEAIFKIRNEPGISFINHIFVEPFRIEDQKATAQLHFGGIVRDYPGFFKEIADYTLVYIFDDEHTL